MSSIFAFLAKLAYQHLRHLGLVNSTIHMMQHPGCFEAPAVLLRSRETKTAAIRRHVVSFFRPSSVSGRVEIPRLHDGGSPRHPASAEINDNHFENPSRSHQ